MDLRKQWSRKYVAPYARVSRVIVGCVFASSTSTVAWAGNLLMAKRQAQLDQSRTAAALAANSKTVLLIGMTGRGKSAFGNLLTGQSDFPENAGAISTPVSFALHSGETSSGYVTVIETAGIMDSRNQDLANMKNFVEQLQQSGVNQLDAVLLVTKLQDVRFDAADQRLLRLYDYVFANSNFWKRNFCLVFTHCDGVAVNDAREQRGVAINDAKDQKGNEEDPTYLSQLRKFIRQELGVIASPTVFCVDSKNKDYGDTEAVLKWIQRLPASSALQANGLRVPLDERCWKLAEFGDENVLKGRVSHLETKTVDRKAPLRTAASLFLGTICLVGTVIPPISAFMAAEFFKRMRWKYNRLQTTIAYKEDLQRDIWIGFDGKTRYETEWQPTRSYQTVVEKKKIEL